MKNIDTNKPVYIRFKKPDERIYTETGFKAISKVYTLLTKQQFRLIEIKENIAYLVDHESGKCKYKISLDKVYMTNNAPEKPKYYKIRTSRQVKRIKPAKVFNYLGFMFIIKTGRNESIAFEHSTGLKIAESYGCIDNVIENIKNVFETNGRLKVKKQIETKQKEYGIINN